MAIPAVSDELWELIHPLLPAKPRRYRYPGRKRLDDRACLNGILFVLKTGIPWEDLPQQLGYGSGMTCWRRLRDWNDAGVWELPGSLEPGGRAPRTHPCPVMLTRAVRLVPISYQAETWMLDSPEDV